jgi:hypothetical protein
MKFLMLFGFLLISLSVNAQEKQNKTVIVNVFKCKENCSVKRCCHEYRCLRYLDMFYVPTNANEHNVRTYVKQNLCLFNELKKTYKMKMYPTSYGWHVNLLRYARKALRK